MINLSSEQKKAIEHTGGVLLQAGAGSGKTFVLVQHIGFIILKFIKKNSSLKSEEFKFHLGSYLNSIVLMTFTKKAAGELSVRLTKYIEDRVLNDSAYKKEWQLVYECIDYLFIGTIHGFCQKIIDQYGHDGGLRGKSLIHRNELFIIQNDLFKDFLSEHGLKDKTLISIVSNRDLLLKSMGDIFSEASLRFKWEQVNNDQFRKEEFQYILGSIFKTEGLDSLFIDKEWENEYLDLANDIITFPKNLCDLKTHKDFFDRYNRLPSRPRRGEQELLDQFDKLKRYRNFLKDNFKHFNSYEKNKNGVLKDWFFWIRKIFDYLNKSHKKSRYMTYSDLEYEVIHLLSCDHLRKKISDQYKYLIIDEFQDTSGVQFNIISNIIDNNFNRIFVVGDIKQAIYGFRGGEISVFSDCKNKVSQNIELKNNYRSLPEIIDFNNSFFPKILQLPDHPQLNPNGSVIERGNVEVREIVIDKKASPREALLLEAAGIINILKEKWAGDTCILYKRLAPSLELIRKMVDSEISFSAQIKISKGEEPILVIFYELIRGYLSGQELSSTLFVINKIFNYLFIEEKLSKENLKKFYMSLKNIGPYYAYLEFLYRQKVSNSLSEINLSFIKNLLDVCHEDIERVYTSFRWFKDETFSFNFKAGSSPDAIQIMTVHSAKGLEFDRIILGGLHAPERRGSSGERFGRVPQSFCWKGSEEDNEFYQTPYFILDRYEKKYRDKLEQRRLLYVAMTRAKKCLTWIDFSQVKESVSERWIKSLQSFNVKRREIVLSCEEEKLQDRITTPFFHQNSLGVLSTCRTNHEILLLGELSVTNIAMLAQCPRKFYLCNILKIPVDDYRRRVFDHSEKPISSMERGKEVHHLISQMIEDHFQNTGDKILEWVKDKLQQYRDFDFMSEEPIKFPLFGLMITGIPDLVIASNRKMMIWDFKTGIQDEDIEQYWIQLKLYAFAMWELKKVDKNSTIDISLLYVDQRKKIDKVINFQSIREEIFSLMYLSNEIDQVNRSHCSHCFYGNLCRF